MRLTAQDRFEIGGEELLASGQAQPAPVVSDAQTGDPASRQVEMIGNIRVRVGALLKTETVSFLFGAGASVDCGGVLLGSIPLTVERELGSHGITGTSNPRIRRWLTVFYLAVRRVGVGNESPVTRGEILARRQALAGAQAEPLKANFEEVLALLHRWRSVLPVGAGRLRVDGSPPVEAKADDLEEAIRRATGALAQACLLPASGKEAGLSTYRTIIRKILTRPLNLKRINVFTLNYDTLVEQAADAEGVVLLDGFVGTQRRVFRPESYEQDLYFPAETTEGRVHRFDRVLHLYKLHGSVTWTTCEPTPDNPYGVRSAAFSREGTQPLVIYPAPAKYSEMLGMPYAELFRRFAGAIVRPQAVLLVIGYGFGDEHVNAIIRQALAVPSFTLVVVDPNPLSKFVARMRQQQDRRVWLAVGPTVGVMSGFVEHVLPDLRDEEIRERVMATYRALAGSELVPGGAPNGD